MLWVEFTPNVCEELAIGACLTLNVFIFEVDSKGKIRVCSFGLKWSKQGRGDLEELVM